MKFFIEKIVKPLELSGYDERYAGHQLLVWVNPPRDVRAVREGILRDYSALLVSNIAPAAATPAKTPEAGRWRKIKSALKFLSVPVVKDSAFDALNQQMFVWLQKVWNQHSNEACAWPVQDIRELYDADPVFYQWLVKHTIQMMDEFALDVKKK